MRVLYHLTLSPNSRKVRLVLAEKNLDFTLKLEKVWERRPEFLALTPAGEVPVLIEPDGTVLAGDPRRPRQSRLPPRLHRLSGRATALARRRPFFGRRHCRGIASLQPRLYRRRAMGRVRAGQGMVCADQVAAELPADPCRSR